MALAYSMDKIGPMARSAIDCATVLAVISGADPKDLGSLPPGSAKFIYPSATRTPLRIGWLTNAWQKPDPDVKAASEAAIAVLKQYGAQVSDAALPAGPWEEAAGTTVSVEGAAAFRSLLESGQVADLSDPLGQVAGYINEQIPAADYLRAQQIRGVLQKKIDTLLDPFDVIAAASLPVTASTLDTNLETGLSFADPLGGIGNFCGLPAISVPCGLSDKKLPIGIQFVGRVRNDRAVVAAAELFQQHTDWHKQRPPIG
jgi:aspartyl-tRNA(Asn)/glutamyl-tRNA(Gln) amidotransferase subunit A